MTEFKRLLAEAGLDADMAIEVLRQHSLASVMVGALKERLTKPFARYTAMLVSPIDWLARLREYNAKYWGNKFAFEDFAKAEAQLALVPTGHVQGVDNIFGFHAQGDSLKETFEMWYKVYQGELPSTWRWPELKMNAKRLRLHKLARPYEPGIHLVNIDLVAHWEPEDRRTVEEVREQAKSSGEILAQLEVVSIYGVLTRLFMEQDGENFPYSDMPGTDVIVTVDSRPHALAVRWNRFVREAEFDAFSVGYRRSKFAAPVLRELQS
ncbi:MAG TPA: hypothetical protein VK963_00860 [Candidatus Saccharimonadales bacterium]|nr:hypothetical protein [Candidatus Saccharimonadales bacterium]